MFFQIMFSLITIFSWISVEATLSYWKKIDLNIFVMQHDVNASKFYISIEFFNVNVNTGLWLWIFTFFANPKKSIFMFLVSITMWILHEIMIEELQYYIWERLASVKQGITQFDVLGRKKPH